MFAGKGGKIVATVEARMTSTRLPGKVLLPLHGEPALIRLLERISRSQYVDEVRVACTDNPTDDPIADLCGEHGYHFHRGSEEDVLRRVLNAAKSASANLIVEITGDCPLVDHRHIDAIIELFYSGSYDYAANTIERSFPDGFDIQVFPVKILEKVDILTHDPIDRVHVSYYIWTRPHDFRLANLKATGFMHWPDLGLTLDEREDYELLSQIFSELYPQDPDFSAEDVVRLMRERPDLQAINRNIRRKTAVEG